MEKDEGNNLSFLLHQQLIYLEPNIFIKSYILVFANIRIKLKEQTLKYYFTIIIKMKLKLTNSILQSCMLIIIGLDSIAL